MATSLTSGSPAERAELPGGMRLEDLLQREWIVADGVGGFAHATDGYLIEAKRWLLLHEAQADAFALKP